ncbi:hypothetical protein [Pseudarthrobacter raffinosi]|uniref:hypothetical protein n=1 Tax=Pseudarthrobacter raffinosi TaxID=2953651 RepID=UPI00208DF923|nr:hypothetical protein [Pseudarthrobacter sp. MDT3-9]MCO4253545.1 hypothetical protein [Pseudarthrobacter sp. MDT3-9]
MQLFDWLLGKDQIGWLKTALLSGLFGGIIFGLSGGFASSPSANKFILIGLGVIPLLLIRAAYWAWRKESLRTALLRHDPRAQDAVLSLLWRKPEVASYLAAFVSNPSFDPVGNAPQTTVTAIVPSGQASNATGTSGNYLGFGPYFAANGVFDLTGMASIPARLYSQDHVWPGYFVVAGHMIGFFDESDIRAPSIADGSPVLLRLAEISGALVSVPAGLVVDVPPGIASEANHGGNLHLGLGTVNNQRMNVAFDFAGSGDEAKARLQSLINNLLNRLARST